jgi:hypothetical protein
MKFLRVVLGLAIAGIAFVAALAMLITFFFFFPSEDGPAERLASVVILALIEGGIFAGAFFAFRKVMGPRPRDDGA